MQGKFINELYLYKLKRDSWRETKYTLLLKLPSCDSQVYLNTFGAEDSDNIRQDIQMLENKVREDQERIRQHSNMIEHIEIFCHSDGDNDTTFLKEKPEHAKY